MSPGSWGMCENRFWFLLPKWKIWRLNATSSGLQIWDKKIGCYLGKLCFHHVAELRCMAFYRTRKLHRNRWFESLVKRPILGRHYQYEGTWEVRSSVWHPYTEHSRGWRVVSQISGRSQCLILGDGVWCHCRRSKSEHKCSEETIHVPANNSQHNGHQNVIQTDNPSAPGK